MQKNTRNECGGLLVLGLTAHKFCSERTGFRREESGPVSDFLYIYFLTKLQGRVALCCVLFIAIIIEE